MKIRGVTILIPDFDLVQLRSNALIILCALFLAVVYWHFPSTSESHLNYEYDGTSKSDGCHVCKMFEMGFKARHFMTDALSSFVDSYL